MVVWVLEMREMGVGVGDVVWWSVVIHSIVQNRAKRAQNKSMETTKNVKTFLFFNCSVLSENFWHSNRKWIRKSEWRKHAQSCSLDRRLQMLKAPCLILSVLHISVPLFLIWILLCQFWSVSKNWGFRGIAFRPQVSNLLIDCFFIILVLFFSVLPSSGITPCVRTDWGVMPPTLGAAM